MKIKMDFVSSAMLDKKPKKKRINFILNKVKDGSILVVDGVMTAEEEMELIRETMRRVDDGFPGIEVCSLKKQVRGFQSFLERLSDQRTRIQKVLIGRIPETSLKTGITLVGPARYIKKIKKNPNSFSVLAEA
ncbi:MAG: DUF2073 domain-containing protein [Candidatus Aenigmarchaeota archaeon]|nr:DUF2073 domain-containing protein [Candidatus Aenigmarchaeota archaeon]